MLTDPTQVDPDEIIAAVCRFHTDTLAGEMDYPTMWRLGDGYLTPDDFKGDDGRANRGKLVAEACRLQRTATSDEIGNPGRVPWVDGREIIRWSDFHAGIMPAGTTQRTL